MSLRIIRLLIISFTVIAVCPFLGSVGQAGGLVNPFTPGMERDIFYSLRVPRVLVTFVVGGALAIAGVVFQAMFRNPLASPYTLGIASAASLGAVIAIHLGLVSSIFSVSLIRIFGITGAAVAILLIISSRRFFRTDSTISVLLIGVVLSYFFSSLILVVQYLSDASKSYALVHWLMGGVQGSGFRDFYQILPFVVLGLIVAILRHRELDMLLLGEEFAHGQGVDVKKTQNTLFLAMSVMIGAVVSFTGPIGFVGIMLPHIVRAIIGSNHKSLIPVCFIVAGSFLVFCDNVTRYLLAPIELPVGVITALLGGPFFLSLFLFRRVQIQA